MIRRIVNFCLLGVLLSIGSACVTNAYEWIGPQEAVEVTPAEDAMHKGRLVTSWSRRHGAERYPDSCDHPGVGISILITNDSIWTGLTTGERVHIRNTEDGYDWDSLGEILREFRSQPEVAFHYFSRDLEIAAFDSVTYEDVLSALDQAIAEDYRGLKLVEPNYLSVEFVCGQWTTRIPGYHSEAPCSG
jgi:hypothetical protein